MVHGFLNVRKPQGMTSHQCVAVVRRIFRTKQVGHGGTLDPMATGVLTMALGKATKLLQVTELLGRFGPCYVWIDRRM